MTESPGELPAEQPRGSGDADVAPSHSRAQIAPPRPRPTFWAEVRITLGSPLYLLITFGYAGWFAVISGLASFGPAFTDVRGKGMGISRQSRTRTALPQGLGMFSSQSVASVTLGASIAAAGIIGTPVGGWLLDWEVNRRWKRVQTAQSVAESVPAPSSGLHDVSQEGESSSSTAKTSCAHETDEVVPEALLALRLQVAMRQVHWRSLRADTAPLHNACCTITAELFAYPGRHCHVFLRRRCRPLWTRPLHALLIDWLCTAPGQHVSACCCDDGVRARRDASLCDRTQHAYDPRLWCVGGTRHIASKFCDAT